MKKVYIKYNPYKIETEVLVDGKPTAKNSKIRDMTSDGCRLQEWIEDLPAVLLKEYNDDSFEITFKGTLLDYEDLTDVFTEAYKQGRLTTKISREPAKETADKITVINEIFKDIQKGPFKELREGSVVNAFELANSSDFEVCVVATMSSGKSTLINAMLGRKLMPSAQEACTAIITRIKDNDTNTFRSEVYDKNGRLYETNESLTYDIMERLNKDNEVSEIKVTGNIPFVTSQDISLVLIDTPGPDNARNPEHRMVCSNLLGKSSKALVLYIMTGDFGTDDDNQLLKRVSESMAVGNKQSKDRFIFVVNKLDDRKTEDGKTEDYLDRVRAYLKNHGIEKPNLFPAAALPALYIRRNMNDDNMSDEDIDEMNYRISKLNRSDELHLEEFSKLPPSIKGEIKDKLTEATSSWNGTVNSNPETALIHTGIVSIEAAIRQYVYKYARTSKIKNIVDTFLNKIEELHYQAKLESELASNKSECEKIMQQIEIIRSKRDSANEAKKFKDAVERAVAEVNEKSSEVIEDIESKFQEKIQKRIDALRGCELDEDDAEDEVERLCKFAAKLEPDFENDLNELITENLIGTCETLFNEYRTKLATLTEEISISGSSSLLIDPLKLMSGSLTTDDFSIRQFIKEKEVEDGEEWVENTDKKWYKPWTWFQKKGWYRTKYKTVAYVDGGEMAQEFFSPIETNLYENADTARTFAIKQSKKIAKMFEDEFKKLDDILEEKLRELEIYATDQKKAEERIRETEERLDWLENIKNRIEAILEI